jgi:hypothetical protein
LTDEELAQVLARQDASEESEAETDAGGAGSTPRPPLARQSRPSSTVAAISPNKLYALALYRFADISWMLTAPEPISDFH